MLPPPVVRASSQQPAGGAADSPCDEDDLSLHVPKVMRVLLMGAGFVCVALGAIGVVLPIMPTVPFLLVAAACFARGSPRCYRLLVASKAFGPPILEWRRHRSIRWRTKLFAMALFFVSFTTSTVLFVRPLALQLVLGAVGAVVLACLYRIPSRDRPPQHR